MADLSPAAQAVLRSFKDEVELTWLTKDPEQVALAAALRVVADQLRWAVGGLDGTVEDAVRWEERERIRSYIYAIAHELEAP